MSDLPAPPIIARPGNGNSDDANRLEPHLSAVQEYALSLLPETSGELETVVAVAAYLHDFGKLSGPFQRYIHAKDRENTESVSISMEKRTHAYLGALATQHILRAHGVSDDWQAVGFFAVAKHHATHLNDFGKITEYMGNVDFGPFTSAVPTEQIESILKNEALREAAGEILASAHPDEISSTEALRRFIQDFKARDTVSVLQDFQPSAPNNLDYIRLLRVWSTITCADKLASAGLPLRAPTPFSPEAITAFIDELPAASGINETLNQRRETARKTCQRRAEAFLNSDVNIGRITLPTGFGKTLTGTQTALTLAQKKQGRVIYALPYTSIIDQTDSILRDVFDISGVGERYTIHHYLAETRTRVTDTEDGDSAPFRDQRLLAKTWQADLVLTTFVQLFESLVSPTNKQSLKLPALQDSVLLIDEPQALSHDWWQLITCVCRLLSEHYNAHVIFMTATQPGLFHHDESLPTPFEFLQDPSPYYGLIAQQPRVKFELHDSAQQYIDKPRTASGLPLVDAAEEISASDGQSTLAICNTIQSTTELSAAVTEHLPSVVNLNEKLKQYISTSDFHATDHDEIIKELIEDAQGNTVISTLTTRIRPLDRKLLLEAIRELTTCSETELYVISTQLVEAGVDVSFERLYRDFAPVPSLVQAAGRCNREFNSETQRVTVWRLAGANETTLSPSQMIYTNSYDLLYPTRDALDQHRSAETITEQTMISDVVETYYERLHATASPGDRTLVSAVEKAQFGKLSTASLITDSYSTADIIVCVDNHDLELVEKYRRLLDDGDLHGDSELQRSLSARTISVPLKSNELSGTNLIPITDEHYYYLDAVSIPSQYALETADGITEPSVAGRASF